MIRFRDRRKSSRPSGRTPEDPIRAELFGIERLEQHAESLAAAHRVRPARGAARRVMARLLDNGAVLRAAYRAIADAIREDRAVTPAAEWLVDNFHVVQEQIREILADLPPGFYRQLPKLAEGHLAGFPRVFGIAWAYVAHTDSRFDPPLLARFVRAYQRVQPLTIGELWAVAIALRIILVENLRRSAEAIVAHRRQRQDADALADCLLGIAGDDPARALTDLQQRGRTHLPTALFVQLLQRLRDQDPRVIPALAWLDGRAAAEGTSADAIVHAEHQRQGAMNVTVRNIITSMRLVSAIDWTEFFESVSPIDALLRRKSDFAAMDFPTRDRYRRAIEEMARGSGRAELDVARHALTLASRARRALPRDADPALCHECEPGHYLIGAGRRALEAELGYRAPLRDGFARTARTFGVGGYLGAFVLLGALILTLALSAVAVSGVHGGTLVWLGLSGALPALDLAMALLNRAVTRLFAPKNLPALELREGVPAGLRTLVVMPTLLTHAATIEKEIERLEVHRLASLDGDLRFALLSDWADSAAEQAADDDELLGVAVHGIARLNERYGPAADGGERFLLLHRRRVWNAGQGRWMGWERKRGKLHELNRLLRGATDTSFVAVAGMPPRVPGGVRYVITLDADTRLPRGVARKLVGRMAHPLNRPRFDAARGRVVAGHAILQPRVTPALPGGGGSLFQRLFSSYGGIDPYAMAVSDVYQDLFDEGSYSGKGIYDVDVFEAALAGRAPENALLSHDLLEGIFARAGLVSDVEVIEEFPARYDIAAGRQHRWTRGDWQLLPWILGRAAADGGRACRAVPALGRWKMIDNLRRSLSAPAAYLALLGGWALPTAAAARWSAFVLITIALPPLLPFLAGIVPRRAGISKRSHWRAVWHDLVLALAQILFLVTLLAHQAWLVADAIARTLFRLLVSRRNLLEWVSTAQASLRRLPDLGGFYRHMSAAVVLAVLAALELATTGSVSARWLIAAPFLALWLVSPALARWASRPASVGAQLPLAAADARTLRTIARRTWRFFDAFVDADNHWLPPDNFQETPKPVIAHRTSPTNMGLYLLSTIAARDFGWIGTLECVARIEATLATMERLERFRGHFYNWYDTRDLRPLEPRYVSTVDSGNLAGHLVALANACHELAARPLLEAQPFAGIADAIAITRAMLRARAAGGREQAAAARSLDAALTALADMTVDAPATPAGISARLTRLAAQAAICRELACAPATGDTHADPDDLPVWFDAIAAGIDSLRADFSRLLPWAETLAELGAEAKPALLAALAPMLDAIPGVADLPTRCAAAGAALASFRVADGAPESADAAWPDRLAVTLQLSAEAATALAARIAALAERARHLFDAMGFDFLFDPTRQLLSIGYRVADGSLDPNCYDLLASEARLASFAAIARKDVPTRHWFQLGRQITPAARGAALVSWSGSMFEYLMPSLVMRAPAGSLLEQTSRMVVARQIRYGNQLGLPWGISESAYNARDLEFTYQYSNFGVPDLGFKRGLAENLVIAPYATALAAMVDAPAALHNFAALAKAGARGHYGWYEALDYTPARLREGERVVVVRAYMAHHQGMSIVALANTLQGGRMRARFHAEPIVQATELLLQERAPRDVAVARPWVDEIRLAANVREMVPPILRQFHTPHDRIPRTHLLGNSRYAVMITGAGSGYSRWHDLAITRWHEDPTCDGWGSYIYLRDALSGAVWSAGHQPSGSEADAYEVAYAEGRAEIVRRDGALTTTLEVVVSPEDDAEVRRVTIANHGGRAREIEVTSFAELVLAPTAADAAHPAFSKMFVQTEFAGELGVLLATRRRRKPDEAEVWAAHLAVVEGEAIGELQYETDRARFLGRGRNLRAPISISDGHPLSGTIGTVLDPVFSLRRRVRVPAGGAVRIAFWTLAAASREAVLDLADRHRDAAAYERAQTLVWTQAQVELHHLGIGPDEAHLYQRIANRVLYADPSLRPAPDVLARGCGGPQALWAHGISGDLPIVLARIDETDELDIVRHLLRAHEYWRMKQLAVDLVILNEKAPSYAQDLQGALEALTRASQARPKDGAGPQGSVYVLRTDLVSAEVQALLQSVARVVLLGRLGSLADQVKRARETAPPSAPPRRVPIAAASVPPPLHPGLEFCNGFGGFADAGREYEVVLEEGTCTPAPWVNVIANPGFGFLVSAEGGGYAWSQNSQQNQLTPWSNDAVGDAPGEVLYLSDMDSSEIWTPTALPIRVAGTRYTARHGQGYSRFAHRAHGIALDLVLFVPREDPVKISRLVIRNESSRPRRLAVTAYVEWVLAATRSASAPFLVTALDAETGALFAQNPWRNEFAGRVAFADLGGRRTAHSADRTEFLGRNGSLDLPAALAPGAAPLSGRVGAGLDPCAVLQTALELAPGAQTEIVLLVGDAESEAAARALIRRYRTADLDAELRAATGFWDDLLGTVQVRTPDRSLDLLVNRWLPYQVLSCRVWARTGFYQSSGAYGFRDQLQDVLALCVARPQEARAQILRAAARQFPEGDVQHWWLPPSGSGIRTRMSDDRIWLPYVIAHYLAVTGDRALLDESLPFLDGAALKPEEMERFFQPGTSPHNASIYEHGARALDASLATGNHRLPLIGTGDWNDGMNRVGAGGKGESVWLAWFLHVALTAFAPIAAARDDMQRAKHWREHAAGLAHALEEHAWDGDWYRRGWYDDGTALGSAVSGECRIDSIAQSWAVLSGVAEPVRAARAMAAVDEYLVRREDGTVLLFTPPFDRTPLDPGYIKGYPPGLRENGGQYTHGAIWSVFAFAQLGDGNKAAELFAILSPIHHASTHAQILRYKVEPYVACADVYSTPPHVGRGGWTWYTGSAGWLYRAATEAILGFHVENGTLRLDPCVPRAWPHFEIVYRHRSARYEISVENPHAVCRGIAHLELDGEPLPARPARVSLADDGAMHAVRVILG